MRIQDYGLHILSCFKNFYGSLIWKVTYNGAEIAKINLDENGRFLIIAENKNKKQYRYEQYCFDSFPSIKQVEGFLTLTEVIKK